MTDTDSFRAVAEEAVKWAEFHQAGPAGLLRNRLDALVEADDEQTESPS